MSSAAPRANLKLSILILVVMGLLQGCMPAYQQAPTDWAADSSQSGCPGASSNGLELRCQTADHSLDLLIIGFCKGQGHGQGGAFEARLRQNAGPKSAERIFRFGNLSKTSHGWNGPDFELVIEEARSHLVVELDGARLSEDLQCGKL